MPSPIQYVGKICATTCTQPHSCWIGKKIPEIPVSTRIGSMPQVPTFCMFGTSAPMIMPSGIIASVPRASTQTTVSQPLAPPAMRSSKSRKLGMRITSSCGTMPRQWRTRWPVK